MTPEEIAAMQAENEKLKKEKAEADKKAIELAEANKNSLFTNGKSCDIIYLLEVEMQKQTKTKE